MGKLANLAKENSNWLLLTKCDSVIVRFDSYEVIPNKLDPTKKSVLYKVILDGKAKFWENASTKVMLFFDELPRDTFVRISRKKWFSKDGVEDTGKSQYEVEKVDTK